MILTQLKIHHLRSLSSIHLQLNSKFNFIVGPNGSGKTSILEAFYLLSCGHSFRSREIAPIISFGKECLTVFAQDNADSMISIQKSKKKPTQIKLNNQSCTATSQLAYALPCQVIYADIFQIIDSSSSVRRALLDWGLFHVKPNYLGLCKEYNRVLKQRNALLKTSNSYKDFIPWDKQLAYLAEALDKLRKEYFSLWHEAFVEVLSLLTLTDCKLSYYKGWDKKKSGKSLEALLFECFASDRQRQFTYYGPHHADLLLDSNDMKAKHTLSRGQQKIILIALKLAQGRLINKNCLYLFDDLPSELDEFHQERLFNYLQNNAGQYVITSTDKIKASDYLSFQEQNTVTLDSKVHVQVLNSDLTAD